MTPRLSFVEIAGNSCYDLLTDHKTGEKFNPEGVRGSDGIRRREEYLSSTGSQDVLNFI